jgi:hypothetical protein
VGGLMMLWWDPGQRFRWPPRPRGVKAHFFFFKEPRPRLPGRTYPLGY